MQKKILFVIYNYATTMPDKNAHMKCYKIMLITQAAVAGSLGMCEMQNGTKTAR